MPISTHHLLWLSKLKDTHCLPTFDTTNDCCMKYTLLLIVLLFALTITTKAQRTEMLFDDNWKFNGGSIDGSENDTHNDDSWCKVNLPHDWSVEDLPAQSSNSIIGPFWSKSIGATATGYTVGGTAWHRKHFTIDDPGKKKYLFCLMVCI